MNTPRRIAVVTGARAEYGLLRPLCRAIEASPAAELLLLVTGMHLSPEFGSTVKEIEADGLPIADRLEMLLSSDTPVGTTKSMGIGLINFADSYAALKPDIVVMLGDRFELMAAALAAVVAGIPIAHIHGGESTEGAMDDQFRNALTKLSHLHFPAAEPYRARLLQMGEDPQRVFNFGSPFADVMREFKPLPRPVLEGRLGFALSSPLVVATFHPVTLEPGRSLQQIRAMLAALDASQAARIVLTHPNADSEGRGLIEAVQEFADARPDRVRAVASLGQQGYLSLLSLADAVVGNSSSGLLEAPYLGVPTVNIGSRQKGRIAPASVIHCEPTVAEIAAALARALDPEFRRSLKSMALPYGEGGFAGRALEALLGVPLGHDLLKKSFYVAPGSVTV